MAAAKRVASAGSVSAPASVAPATSSPPATCPSSASTAPPDPSASAPRLLDEGDVLVERRARPVGHHRARAELEGGGDQLEVRDVVELHACPSGRALSRGAHAGQQLLAALGRKRLSADQQHHADVAAGGRGEHRAGDLEVVTRKCARGLFARGRARQAACRSRPATTPPTTGRRARRACRLRRRCPGTRSPAGTRHRPRGRARARPRAPPGRRSARARRAAPRGR